VTKPPSQTALDILQGKAKLEDIDMDKKAKVKRCMEILKERKRYCQLTGQKWWF
jgi:hypothetical protein